MGCNCDQDLANILKICYKKDGVHRLMSLTGCAATPIEVIDKKKYQPKLCHKEHMKWQTIEVFRDYAKTLEIERAY